jgi:branched-chain amino acid transport system ATP-binding protein
MNVKNILELKNVSKNFGGLAAVQNLNLDVTENQIAALIGPNGAGKTTVFNMITGAYKVTDGEIIFAGEKINDLPSYRIAKKGIARTYQNIRLFKNATALQNVMTGFHCRTKAGFFNIVYNRKAMLREEAEVRQKSIDLLKYLNMEEFIEHQAKNLPYGRQRLLEIARALAMQPRLLLLDEPAAGMNSTEKMELISTINRIKNDFKLSVLLVEHDMELVMNISDRITVLNYGAWIASGTPEEVQKNEQVIEAYLGRKEESSGKEC